jgi:hypothetical protein
MLSWPHSGFHLHDRVFVPEGDTDFAMQLARYCARNAVALDRMEYTGRVKADELSLGQERGPHGRN